MNEKEFYNLYRDIIGKLEGLRVDDQWDRLWPTLLVPDIELDMVLADLAVLIKECPRVHINGETDFHVSITYHPARAAYLVTVVSQHT